MWRKALVLCLVGIVGFSPALANSGAIGEDNTQPSIQKNRLDQANAIGLLARDAAFRDNNATMNLRYDYVYTIPDAALPTGSTVSSIVTVTDVATVGTVTIDYDWDTDSYPGEGSFTATSPAGTEATIGAGDTDGHYTVALTSFTGEDLAGDWTFTIIDSWGDGGHSFTGATMNVDIAATDPEVALSTTSIDFGGLPVDFDADYLLTISNTGGGDLTITDISTDDVDFTVDVSSAVVPAFGSLDVYVNFAPSTATLYTANLTITSDAASSPDVVTLAGEGLAMITSGGPDALGYEWVSSLDDAGPTYSWIDGTDATDADIAYGDDYRGTIDLPFEFWFHGNYYTQITGTTNGWIGLGPSSEYTSSFWTNEPIPDASTPNNVIAPLWDDFKAGDSPGSTSSAHGTILYKTLGTEPNREFVVIFDEIVRGTYDTDYFSFEVIFDEATNNITFQYLDVTGNTSADYGVGATIGLENGDGTDGLEVGYNGDPQLIYPGMAIEFIAPPEPIVDVLPVLINEIVVTPTGGEFVELYNPNYDIVDLTDYYLTDATYANGGAYYYNITTGADYGGGSSGDFHARFPAGTEMGPGEYLTVAMSGSDAFFTEYGVYPDLELWEDEVLPLRDDIPDMLEAVAGSINGQGGLTNGDEVIIVYYWDGVTDLVSDSDYLLWNDDGTVPNEAVDKTGVTIGSSTYADDTPIANQDMGESPGYGFSLNRIDVLEGTETLTGGNGITGHDETSENTSATFALGVPSPGADFHPYDWNEPNDGIAEATPVVDGDYVEALIDPDDDLDFYTFTLAEEQLAVINMWVDGFSDLDSEIRLFDSDSVSIASADGAGSGGDEMLAEVLDAGTYYVVAGYWLDVRASIGAYAIEFNFYDDFNEPNDSFDDATDIADGDTLMASIEVEGDLDYYTFDLAEISSVTIDMLISGYSDLDAEIVLYDGDMNELESNDACCNGADEQIVMNALEAGTYYILMGYWLDVPRASTGEYAAALTVGPPLIDLNEPNDNLADATPVIGGDMVSAIIEPDGDLDFYTFTLAEEMLAVIHLYAEGYSDLDSEIRLLDSDSVSIASSDVGYSGGDEEIVEVLAAGTYYVVAGYWLDVRASTGAYAISFGFYHDYNEENNSFETATEVALGDTLEASIEVDDDLDYYTFDIPFTSTVTIDMLINGYSDLDAELVLYDAEFNELADNDACCSGADEQIVSILAPGTYYALAGYWLDVPRASTGDYLFAVNAEPFSDCDFTQVFVNVTTASFGSEVSFDITDMDGNVILEDGGFSSYTSYDYILCLEDGLYFFNAHDSYGDGWNGGTYAITDGEGVLLSSGGLVDGYEGSWAFAIGDVPLPDLVVNSMAYADQILSVEIMNIGTAPSFGFFGTDYHGVYVDGLYLGYFAEMGVALDAGESFTYDLVGIDYYNFGPGMHQVVVNADVDNDVLESDETNNSDTLDIDILVPPAGPYHLDAWPTSEGVQLSWSPSPEDLLPVRALGGYGIEGIVRKDVPARERSAQLAGRLEEARQDNWNLREPGDTCEEAILVTRDTTSAPHQPIWYTWTASGNGHVIITSDLIGQSVDTRLYVYDACEGNEIAYADDNGVNYAYASTVAFNVSAGTAYKIFWDDYWSSAAFDFLVLQYDDPLPQPDYIVSEMWAGPDGESVAAVITNDGTADATVTSYADFWVDDIYAGWVSVPPLAIAESDTFWLVGLTYQNFGPGTFTILVESDADGNIAELDETNNDGTFEFTIDEPDYIPAFNVYRDDVLIAGDIPPIDFFFNGGFYDWGLAIGEYCYEVTQILPDETESVPSNEACAMVDPKPPINLTVMPEPDGSATLNWVPPLPSGEVSHDDNSAERWFWVGGPSTVDQFFALRMTPPVPEFDISHISVLALGDEPSMFENLLVVGSADGLPDLDNVLFASGPVGVNATWDTGPEWVLLPTGGTGAVMGEFFILSQWPDGSNIGPFIGTDDNTVGDRSFWTNDAGAVWNPFASTWMFRAYLEVGGELVAVDPTGAVDRSISTPENAAASGESITAPGMGWLPDEAHRDFLGTFNVYRGTDPFELDTMLVGDLADLTFNDLPDVFDVEYFYAVAANYDEGESPLSNFVAYTPMALPWMTMDLEWGFGVDMLFGDDFASDTFGIGNIGLDTLDFMVSYEIPVGRIIQREIDGAHMYAMGLPPVPGETTDIVLYAQNASSDAEWLDSVSVTFPVGITVNSSTDLTVVGGTRFLQTNNATGDGATVEWWNHDGGFGNIYSTELAACTLNVSVDAAYDPFNIYFDYYLLGDIYGAEPHEVWGSFLWMIPAFTIDVVPPEGFVEPQGDVDVAVNVNTYEYQPGWYPGMIHVDHNDPNLPPIVFPFDVWMAPPTGTLVGHVASTYGDNAPIADAHVVAADINTFEVFDTMTDPDGNYGMELPVGVYELIIGHPDYFPFETQITIAMDAETVQDAMLAPAVFAPFDLSGDEDGGIVLNWAMPEPMLVAYHDGTPSSGFFQWLGQGYGTVFDLSEYGPASLEYMDFVHYGWGLGGLFDYNLHIVDWHTFETVAVIYGLQTTLDAAGSPVLEAGIDLGGLEGLDWVGIFIEPLSGDPTDAYPDISTDATPAEPGRSFIVDIADVGNEPLDLADITSWDPGDFLLNLWIMVAPGDLVAVGPELDREYSTVMADAAESRGSVSGWEGIGLPTEDDALRSEFLHFNIYRSVDFGAWSFLGTSDSTHYFDADVTMGLNYGYTVSALYDIAESATSDTIYLDYVNVDELGLPLEYALHQNYPNPFNPITSVRYDLPEATHVKLVVYNILGQKITTLVDQQLSAGYHSITWSGLSDAGQPVSSGIYMYRMESDGFTEVKKMMFLK